MRRARPARASPNENIDAILDALMAQIRADPRGTPPEVSVKIVTAAISWEKVKASILADESEDFDPDED